MEDRLLPGTLHTAFLRPVNKNSAFDIGVVEIGLLRFRLWTRRLKLATATAGRSGSLPMRYQF